MKNIPEKYKPIDCSFHDILLDRATRRKTIQITYHSENQEKETTGIIKDVYTKSGAEYLLMDDGVLIRLDHLILVDGEALPSGSCRIK